MFFTQKKLKQGMAYHVKGYRMAGFYMLRIIMASLLSFLFASCSSSKHSSAEIAQEKQTILSYLTDTYPTDSFTIQKYSNHRIGGPKWISTRKDYQKAGYQVFSEQLNQPFIVYFKWDDTWSNVIVTKNEYPYLLLSRAQQQRIEALTLSYPIKAISGVMSKKNDPSWLSQVKNVQDALAFLDKSEALDIYSIILVTVPNATDEPTLIQLTEKIQSHLVHINRKDNSDQAINSDIYFYSDDQMDVSEILLDFSTYQPIANIVVDLEAYYNIDSPYYQVLLSKNHKQKGSRFGM